MTLRTAIVIFLVVLSVCAPACTDDGDKFNWFEDVNARQRQDIESLPPTPTVEVER